MIRLLLILALFFCACPQPERPIEKEAPNPDRNRPHDIAPDKPPMPT